MLGQSIFDNDFSRAVISGFRNYFNFRGKSTKSEFWYFALFWFIAYIVAALLDHATLTPVIDLTQVPLNEFLPFAYMDPEVGLLTLLYRPLTALPTATVSVRRLHDVGKSGWYALLWVLPIPILGWFWLIPLLLRPSQDRDNDY